MSDINNVTLTGRLTRNPETTTTPSGKALCKFTLAVGRQKNDEVDFIPIVTWNKTAEFASKYFTKGQRVGLKGEIRTRTWDDDDGRKHYATEVVAESVCFMDSKSTPQATPQATPQDDEIIQMDDTDGLPF